ncbi:MAG: sulfotransferase [Candidatus Poribacteria bacterium]|nr:sulfotransferase [Candidatus Poribacteria bacterium]
MIAQINSEYITTRPTKALTRLISYAFFEGRPVTTKGRWINPVVFSLLKKAASSSKRFTSVEKPVFILGTGRSGTTVLGIVLSMHRDVGFLNEPKAMWHLIHPHEDIIGNYSLSHAKYRLNAEDATDEMCQRAAQMFGAYLSVTGSKRLVDKYPELIFRVDFVRALFPDARFIFLVRNGWDTCHSIANWSKRLGVQVNGEKHDWWGVEDRKWKLIIDQLVTTDADLKNIVEDVKNLDRHLDRASVEWVITMREGLHLIKNFTDSTYKIHFEELTSKPEETLSPLCEFCELPTDSAFLNYAQQTLKPLPPREPFDLHPKIAPIFYDTMTRLGYNN